jgi:hypothetical protein
MRNVLILLFCVFGVALEKPLYSQILKVNKNNLNKDSANYWLGALSFNFDLNNRSVTSENENTFVGLTGTTDLVYLSDMHAYILINNINYFTSSSDDGAFISTGYSHFRLNWLRKKNLSYETYSQVQYDKGRNMQLRFLVGGGIRYRLTDSDETLVVIGTGIMQEHEEWQVPDMEETIVTRNIWKNSTYVNGTFQLADPLKLDVIVYYQGGYDEKSDLFRNRINGDMQLTIQISNRLSFLAIFSGQYEDEPIIPINKFIYSFKNGIKWVF